MDRVRIGMIGAQFAARFHLNSLSKLRGLKADVVAVASRTGKSAAAFAKAWDIPEHCADYRRLLERSDIDVIDLCVPTDLHEQFCIEAARAGKHIICEKPLTGYFGKDRPEALVGDSVDKGVMLKETLAGCDRVLKAVKENNVKFMYAENWIYAPPIAKLKSLIKVSGGTLLDIRAERATPAPSRPIPGGGRPRAAALMRLGAHPVGGVLHLKHYEGQC